jgi:hypothetical protein
VSKPNGIDALGQMFGPRFPATSLLMVDGALGSRTKSRPLTDVATLFRETPRIDGDDSSLIEPVTLLSVESHPDFRELERIGTSLWIVHVFRERQIFPCAAFQLSGLYSLLWERSIRVSGENRSYRSNSL